MLLLDEFDKPHPVFHSAFYQMFDEGHYMDKNYDVDLSIPDDVMSVNLDLDHMEIYIPLEFEYSQYTIDNDIRKIASYLRTDVRLDRDIYIMSLSSKVTFDQYYKIIKAIIREEGFCSIVKKS